MYDNKLKKLDSIIKTTLNSIDISKKEINEISLFAKKEYIELEEEFIKLRQDASIVIETVDKLEKELNDSKNKLAKVNQNHNQYSEDFMKQVYVETDSLRIRLAVEKEKEQSIVKRRNDLEIHLKSVLMITEKADKLSNYFNIASSAINGELTDIGDEVDDINRLKNWGIKAIQVQELERKRIARDMHDGPTQSLTNLIFKTEVCIKLLDKDIEQTKIELQTLKNLIRSTIDETRRIIYNLRPMSIDDLGLVATLERYIDKFENDTNIEVSFNYNDFYYDENDENLTLTFYRVAQEILSNVYKHAEATKVKIDLRSTDKDIKFLIVDNGIGFEDNNDRSKYSNTGFGLVMLKERIAFLGGEFNIFSEIHKGTAVEIKIPLSKGDKCNHGKNKSINS